MIFLGFTMQENNNNDTINLDQILTEDERNALGLISDEKQRAFNSLPLSFWILVVTTFVIGFTWGISAVFFPAKFSERMVTFSLYSKAEAIQIIQFRGQRVLFLLAVFSLAIYKRIGMRYIVEFIIIFLIYNSFKDFQLIYEYDSFQTSAISILFLTTRTIVVCSLIYIWLTLRQISHVDRAFPRKFTRHFFNKYLRFLQKK
jgi:hypothetical protein